MKHVVMLCTAAAGGMTQIVENLRASGLFAKYPIRLLITHERAGTLRRAWVFFKAMNIFVSWLLTSQVALVHAHVAMRGSFWRKAMFLALARAFRRPTVVHLHGSQFREFFEKECGPVRRKIIRRVLEQSSSVIVLSDSWRTYVGEIAPAANTVVVHNFVDLCSLRADLERESIQRSANVILFLGEIGRRKGIYDLVSALPYVIRTFSDAVLIVGGTGEIEKVRRHARQCGVEDHVKLLGWVTGAVKTRLLAEAALYVLPSYNEGLPVSILEAMGAGLPVVSTPVGGIPDVIDGGQVGILVTPGEIGELARRIVELLSDPALRARMGASARERLHRDFSPNVAIETIAKVYETWGVQRRSKQAACAGASLEDG